MISFIWHLEERQTGDRKWTAIAQGWGGRKENIGRLVGVIFKKFHFNFSVCVWSQECSCLWSPERELGPLEGDRIGCEAPTESSESGTWESSKCS